MSSNLISYLIFIPILAGIFILLLKSDQETFIKYFGVVTTFVVFFISLNLYFNFDSTKSEMQFVENVLWISSLNVSYYVGVDGLSLLLLMLTTFLTPIALIASWKSIEKNVKQFIAMILFLETGMIGVFVSLDLFLFYMFWEVMLIPMYFLIGIWGGENRVYAAVKFFLYTMFGSLLMLVAILWLASSNANFTTNYFDILKTSTQISQSIQLVLFLAFALSFAIKVPLFPFHTWLPDAHVQAPTAGSVILAGILLKMGTYGLIRFCIPFFPKAAIFFAPYISTLAVIGIVYGALVSIVQDDMKKLVAYSSVSHLGFVVLGIFSGNVEGTQGAIIQMINHGLSTGMLFLLVGMIYERTHTREISHYGGIAKVMPIYSTFLFIATLSSVGFPSLNGFVGEFLILLGAFKSQVLDNKIFSIISATGVIFAAVYLFWLYQRIIFGEITNEKNKTLTDLSLREISILIPIVIFMVWIGIYPNTFLKISENFSNEIVKNIINITSK